MRLNRTLASLPIAGVLLLAAACGSSTPAATPAASQSASSPGSSSPDSSSPGASTSTSAAPAAVSGEVAELKTGSTALGEVVTDGAGMTLYMFTKDTQGAPTSACTGQCLTAWPPALAGLTNPTLTGVTGTLASIDTPDGKKQLTLGGWPLYYFAKDAKAGDVTGQGVGKVWFVLDEAGAPVRS